jgi:antitoxin HigA-1
VLREEFLVPMKLSPDAVARVVGVPRTRIERLVNGQTALTADTALRLAKGVPDHAGVLDGPAGAIRHRARPG